MNNWDESLNEGDSQVIGGCTRLYASAIEVIESVQKHAKNAGLRNPLIHLELVTDGEDNRSRVRLQDGSERDMTATDFRSMLERMQGVSINIALTRIIQQQEFRAESYKDVQDMAVFLSELTVVSQTQAGVYFDNNAKVLEDVMNGNLPENPMPTLASFSTLP